MVAVPSAVAMSKVTPPAGAGCERLTVESKEVMPLLPSFADTSSMLKLNSESHGFNGLAVLRGAGAPAEKSAALLSVSVQPFPTRTAAVVLLKVGAAPVPSKKLALP